MPIEPRFTCLIMLAQKRLRQNSDTALCRLQVCSIRLNLATGVRILMDVMRVFQNTESYLNGKGLQKMLTTGLPPKCGALTKKQSSAVVLRRSRH